MNQIKSSSGRKDQRASLLTCQLMATGGVVVHWCWDWWSTQRVNDKYKDNHHHQSIVTGGPWPSEWMRIIVVKTMSMRLIVISVQSFDWQLESSYLTWQGSYCVSFSTSHYNRFLAFPSHVVSVKRLLDRSWLLWFVLISFNFCFYFLHIFTIPSAEGKKSPENT